MTESQLQQIKSVVRDKLAPFPHSQHGLTHVQRVWHNAQRLALELRQTDSHFLILLEATCYLHDLGNVKSSPLLLRYVFEAQWTLNLTTPLLKGINLPESEISLINHAILRHPWSIPFHRLNKQQDILTQILQDADSIDYFHPLRFLQPKVNLKSKSWGFLFLPIVYWYERFGQNHIHWFLNQPQFAPYARTVYSHTWRFYLLLSPL